MLTWAWLTVGQVAPASIRQNTDTFMVNFLNNDRTLDKECRLANIDLGQRATLAELSAGVCDANRRYLIAFDPRLKVPVCLSELHLIDEAQVI